MLVYSRNSTLKMRKKHIWFKWVIAASAFITLLCAGIAVNFSLRLTRVTPTADSNFHWHYYLYLPASIHNDRITRRVIHLLVLPNNSLVPSDNISFHDNWAIANAFVGQAMFGDLNVAILVPAFPRPAEHSDLYTHALDRDTLTTDIPELKRLDLQLVAMIDDASVRLSRQGWTVDHKVLLMGFSASAMFVNRFAILQPERVLAAAIGSPGGWPIAPVAMWEGQPLRYPIGVADLPELTGLEFDLDTFRTIPLLFFLGGDDTNDSVPHTDSYNEADRDLVVELFGYMPVDRWPVAESIYASVGAIADFELYSGVPHTITLTEIRKMRSFFKQALEDGGE
jgi:hypothetical protein